MTQKIKIKSEKQIKAMKEGGKKLSEIKKKVKERIKEGVSAEEIENITDKLIKKAGGEASFKMVPKYNWATCINLNEGVVHGIPHKELVFKKGDLVSLDIGFYYQGLHTDTAFTKEVNSFEKKDFLQAGKKALKAAISLAKAGNRVWDISKAIEDSLSKADLTPIRALVGHGVGESLHEYPQIPCFVSGDKKDTARLPEGAVFAIEVMYTQGQPDIVLGSDSWTISTKDGKIAGLFEETVAVVADGPVVLT